MIKGICCAGNMIVDITYPIETWPKQNELTHITEGITRSTGGSVCDNISDLARLGPALPLVASGFAGHDAEGDFVLQEMGKYKNIDLSMVKRSGDTSFTAVMSNNQTKERTFFQYAGGSAYYGEDDIDWDRLNVDIFHIGYILLLPHLDGPDAEYGTKMARLLHRAQQAGMKTSIDVVSEAGERFKRLVTPALKYTDYCIINELETQQTTGVLLRGEDGTLHVENMKAASVTGMMEIGCDGPSSHHAGELAHQYDGIWAGVGSHPDDAEQVDEARIGEYRALCKDPRVKAIGEIGLDYHYEDPPRDVQQRAFRMQMKLAQELSLPVVIHEREAHEDGLRIISDFPDVTGVFHCFSGSYEMAKELVKRGWYIGFTGVVTFKNARKAGEVAEKITLDRILIETDCPYMAPEPFRGCRNDPSLVPFVAKKIAALRGISAEDVAAATAENARRLFRI